MKQEKYRIAAVQAAPVYMDREATLEKAVKLISEASKNKAKLVVLPEAFIPTYPDWIWFVPPGRMALNQELYAELLDQAVSIPGPVTDKLAEAARKYKVYVVIGVNERNTDASGGTLYNTLLYFDPEGNLIGRHQKLVPTVSERTVWGYGDPGTLQVYDTDLGKLGGLICHENYMPLVRYSLYGRGIEIYTAPTYDESDSWQSTLRHIGREGRVYAVGCCMILRKKDILKHHPDLAPFYADIEDWVNTGNSMITGPGGEILAGPLSKKEGILYADVDRKMLMGTKWNLDVAGHYARPDSFQLKVRTSSTPILNVVNDDETAGDLTNEISEELE